jgi:hypothetical protein
MDYQLLHTVVMNQMAQTASTPPPPNAFNQSIPSTVHHAGEGTTTPLPPAFTRKPTYSRGWAFAAPSPVLAVPPTQFDFPKSDVTHRSKRALTPFITPFPLLAPTEPESAIDVDLEEEKRAEVVLKDDTELKDDSGFSFPKLDDELVMELVQDNMEHDVISVHPWPSPI